MSLEFITREDIISAIENDIKYRKVHTTKRNGNSISLRPIVYNCIREIYFEINDYERVAPENLESEKSFYWTAPIGTAIHERIQTLTRLDECTYTEKLMTFNSFAPLKIRSKCDGIDTRDPNNIILYEIKTKDKIPSKPYREELLQNLLSVFLFRRECNLNIKGSSMIYVDRNDPYNIVFFNYDFFDKLSPLYLDPIIELKDTFEKIYELLRCLEQKKIPDINSKFIKKFAYGRCMCDNCVYRKSCAQE